MLRVLEPFVGGTQLQFQVEATFHGPLMTVVYVAEYTEMERRKKNIKGKNPLLLQLFIVEQGIVFLQIFILKQDCYRKSTIYNALIDAQLEELDV